MSLISKKICIIGESEVGKNSLICRFVERQFSEEYLATVGVQISRKTLQLQGVNSSHQLNIQLLIWSITGHPNFKAIAPTYLRGSSGAVVVADLTRPETIERLAEHIQLFLAINPKGFIIVALNKCDLIEQEQLAELIQLQNLEQVVSGIYPISAKTGFYVDDIFLQIAYKILESCDNGFSAVQTSLGLLEDFSNDRRGGEENQSLHDSDAEHTLKQNPQRLWEGRGEPNDGLFLLGCCLATPGTLLCLAWTLAHPAWVGTLRPYGVNAIRPHPTCKPLF
jgi:small GTP-binding protein